MVGLLRFPDLRDLGPLSGVEWETLRSLNRACVDLEQEWEAARAQAGRAITRSEVAEGYTEDSEFRYHVAAVDEACEPAAQYERRISEITWRYASASALLGITVLDRSSHPPSPPSASCRRRSPSRRADCVRPALPRSSSTAKSSANCCWRA